MVSTITTTSASQIVVKKALFSVVFLRFVISCSVCLFVILIESINFQSRAKTELPYA